MKLNAAGVGIRIRQARTAKGWTQMELASQLGVQRSSVVRWENGVSVPQCIPEIARLLGQPAPWFMDRADERVAAATGDSSKEVAKLNRELRQLHRELNKKTATVAPVPTSVAVEVAVRGITPITKEPTKVEPIRVNKDEAVLRDVLEAWNRVNTETRLMAALMLTGDWSYKLKLWNLDIAVGEDVLKAIGTAHRLRNR